MSQENYKSTWFIVPTEILSLPGLTLDYLKVYQTIFEFWNKRLPCFLTNDAITERTGVKKREIQRALEFFEKHKELEREMRGKRRYIKQPLKEIETDSSIDDGCQSAHPCSKNDQKKDGSRVSISPPQGCQSAHPEYKEKKKRNNINKLEKTCSNSVQDHEYRETLYPMPTDSPPVPSTSKGGLLVKSSAVALDPALNVCDLTTESISEYLDIRSSKKVPLTPIAWRRIQQELSKCDNPQDAFEEMITRGWIGFKKEWLFGMQSSKKDLNHENLDWIKGEHARWQ